MSLFLGSLRASGAINTATSSAVPRAGGVRKRRENHFDRTPFVGGAPPDILLWFADNTKKSAHLLPRPMQTVGTRVSQKSKEDKN
eukprot:m.349481 g.349481  ORF g.349481 m.349481 type:complete len:85 (-) comp16572_c1_seq5:226-480(-)